MVPMVAASPLMRIKAINGITKKLIYFDLFLITGMLPTDWKLARVVPIPKLDCSKDPAMQWQTDINSPEKHVLLAHFIILFDRLSQQ